MCVVSGRSSEVYIGLKPVQIGKVDVMVTVGYDECELDDVVGR